MLKKLALSALVFTGAVASQAQELKQRIIPETLEVEAKSSLTRGVNYLLKIQEKNGSWRHHPAITSLCTLGLAHSFDTERPEVKKAIENGLKFIRTQVQEDGSIWNKNTKEYPNYATAVSLIALAYINNPKDEQIIRDAREFLLDSQFSDVPVTNASYGGVGYGKRKRPDLSNTQLALEALYVTDYLDREPYAKSPDAGKKADAMWERARKFLTRCQNLEETNDQEWASSDPENRGSFIYLPENKESKAGETVLHGKKVLRGYGSMTYAGLKSMLYARVNKDDVRVRAAYDWLMKNWTLNENPGMKLQGHYYYLQTMAKALATLEQDYVIDVKGVKHNWRVEMLKKFISVQRGEGEWYNTEGRWWESDPALVSAYSMISVGVILRNKK